jgi:hypothetical protein
MSVFEQCLTNLFHFLKIFVNLVTVNNPEFPVMFDIHGEVIWRGSKTLVVAEFLEHVRRLPGFRGSIRCEDFQLRLAATCLGACKIYAPNQECQITASVRSTPTTFVQACQHTDLKFKIPPKK